MLINFIEKKALMYIYIYWVGQKIHFGFSIKSQNVTFAFDSFIRILMLKA